MTKTISGRDISFLALSFFIPFFCFYFTGSYSLMFDDAAEFALVIKLGSIAHPPGSPAYILTGMLWTKLLSLFGINTIDSLTIFSGVCASIASSLLYLSFKKIAYGLLTTENIKSKLVCLICAIGFATGATTWAWANTVEVYSFQVLSMALVLYGLINYNISKNQISLLIAAIGISSGLGNHHLTMVIFLPIIPFFFIDNLFFQKSNIEKKKKGTVSEVNLLSKWFEVLRMPKFWMLTGLTTLFTLFYYGWMFIRAQHDYPFMFGQPNTISELIYHVSGATYVENINSGSQQILESRFPYFLKLTFFQLFVFLPFFILGMIIIYRKKLLPLFWIIISYYIVLFLYQLNNNQWGSTDAYMLLPFTVLYIGVFYGAITHIKKLRLEFVLPVLLCIQLLFNFGSHNRQSYPVSESLMKLLDKSAPANSIILISDWTMLMQYYFYRITENFRPDLTVLSYDIKFEHYKILPILYPDFYPLIKSEYDSFVNELMKTNPHQADGTGLDLTTMELVNKFKTLINKIENVASTQGKYFLTDPKAHYFFGSTNLYAQSRFVSGCFSSSMPGEQPANDYFLNLEFDFLNSPLLLNDPAAIDKLVDFQSMLDNYLTYYTSTNDSLNYSKTMNAREKIFKLQREMKKNMPFAFQTN